MSTVSHYDEALKFIKQNPGTGGASSLAKLVLSLYNSMCGYSFAECVGNLDGRLTALALRMVEDYAKHGETEHLRVVGKIIVDEYPRLWEMSIAMADAREATREKWKADERKAERDELRAAEALLFTDPNKLIPPATAKELLDQQDPLYAYTYSDFMGDWKNEKLKRETVHAAIDLTGGGELSHNCPEGGNMMAVRIDDRVYYVSTDYDAREAYLEPRREERKPGALRVSVPPRSNQP